MDPVYHRGRLIDHIGIVATDLERTKKFYRAVMAVFGIEPVSESPDHIAFDELWIDGRGKPSPYHLAFQAKDHETVHRFYEAAIAAGGRDNGKPGERDYHPGYYAAFVLDPDGYNIEAVNHGPASRNVASVELKQKHV